MSIWFKNVDLAVINRISDNTLINHLGIKFTEIGPDYLRAQMPVDQRTHQPIGIMHGGASCVLAETLGSTAGNLCLDQGKYYCVGLEINANHVKSIRSGMVFGTTQPIHLGKTTQIWEIKIIDEKEQLIAISRLTSLVLTLQKP